MVGISKDIVESFLKKLNDDNELPENVTKELRVLLESNEKVSKDKILQAINVGLNIGNNSQKD